MPKKKRKSSSKKANVKANVKISKFGGKSSIRARSTPKKKTLSLKNIFSLGNARVSKENQNFNTSFVYGNLSVDLKTKTQGSQEKIVFNLSSKNFSFSGELVLNEKLFKEIQKTLYPVVNNIRKLANS